MHLAFVAFGKQKKVMLVADGENRGWVDERCKLPMARLKEEMESQKHLQPVRLRCSIDEMANVFVLPFFGSLLRFYRKWELWF